MAGKMKAVFKCNEFEKHDLENKGAIRLDTTICLLVLIFLYYEVSVLYFDSMIKKIFNLLHKELQLYL